MALPILRITKAEWDSLLEYSHSLPTGQTEGKRWKKLTYGFTKSGKGKSWIVGEYGGTEPSPSNATERMRVIRWYRPVVIMPRLHCVANMTFMEALIVAGYEHRFRHEEMPEGQYLIRASGLVVYRGGDKPADEVLQRWRASDRWQMA